MKNIVKTNSNAEEAFLELQEIYKSIVETEDKAGGGIIMLQNVGNIEGVIIFINDAALRITGYAREEIIGKIFQDLLVTDNISDLMDRYRRGQVGEDLPDYPELLLLRKDGTRVPVKYFTSFTTYKGKRATIAHFRDISERKNIEEALLESQGIYRSMVETAVKAGIGICITQNIGNKDGVFVFANDEVLRISGYTKEELYGKEFQDILLSDNISDLIDRYRRRQAGEQLPGYSELWILRKDGSTVPIECNAGVISYESKVATIAYIRDISERKLMEEKHRQLLEDMQDGYAVLQDGKYVFTNRRFCEILGYEPGKMLGKSFIEILLPHDRQSVMELYEKVMRGEEAPAEKFVNEVVKADGTTAIVEASTKAILFENKIAFSVMIRDITELKKAQDDLKRSEEYFRSLIENTSDVIDVLGADGNVKYMSPSVEHVLGYKQEELIGKTGFDLIHPDDLSIAMTAFNKTMETSRYSDTVEIRIRHKDGSWRTVQALGNNLLDRPPVAGVVTYIRDVTERKSMEEKYRQLLEDMKDGYLVAQGEYIVFSNRRFAEIFGYEPEQLIWPKVTEFIAPDGLQEIIELYMKVINGEEEPPERLELMAIKKDGTTFPIQAGARLIEYDGKPAYSVIVRDLTERKHMDDLLKDSREKLQSIIQALPDILSHVSRDGTFLDEPMGHYDRSEQYPSTFSTKKLYDIFPNDFTERALETIEIALNNGVPQVMENITPISTGTEGEVIYETRIVPFGRDEVLAISRDITAQKLSERKLHTYQQQLQSLSSQLSQAEERERRRLAVDLHDLIGQPLAVIKMKFSGCQDTLNSTGHASTMKEVMGLLETTINSARSLTFDLSPPVLYELGLEAALEFLLEQFQEHYGLKYEFNDGNQEKSLEDEVCILLYRCVSELLMNVVKHSKAQLVKLSICRENSYMSITLEDNGVGFSASEVELEGEAQGFGLFSVRERLSWIGGSFELESNQVHGTCVTLKAPLDLTA